MKIFDNKVVQALVLICIVVSGGFAVKNYVDNRFVNVNNELKGLKDGLNGVTDWNKVSLSETSPFHRLMLKESLRKFRYVFDKKYEVPKNYVNKYPNRIWVYGGKGLEKISNVIEKCIESMKKHSGGRIVEIVDDTNFDKYVKVPDYIVKKYKEGKILHQQFSDIIRILLLRDYGGVYMDITTYLTRDIPQCIFDAEFYAPLWYPSVNSKNFNNFRSNIFVTNCFMATNAPHNYIFQCWAEFAFEVFKEFSDMPYLTLFVFPALAIEESGKIHEMMRKMVSMCGDMKYSDIGYCLNKPFNKEEWEEIKKRSTIHKMSSRGIRGLLYSGKAKPGTFLDKLLNGKLN